MKRIPRVSLWIVVLAALPATSTAEVRLPNVLADHVVLQRNRPVVIWGQAEPGERVRVTLGEETAEATADDSGAWEATLPPRPAGGPYTITIRAQNTLTLSDVLLGDVWFCSGQSNMHWRLHKSANAEQEIATADFPKIRLCKVETTTRFEKQSDAPCGWEVCSPETVWPYSAVAYLFAREMHQTLDVPIGVIQSEWGGTRILPWIAPEGFQSDPYLKTIYLAKTAATAAYRECLAERLDKTEAWVAEARKALADGVPVPWSPTPRNPLGSHYPPASLYNAMVHPFVRMPVRGILWYQGESNVRYHEGYARKQEALIRSWRRAWGRDDLPFLFVQIAPCLYSELGPGGPYQLPLLREEQERALSLPATAMVVTTDIGELDNIHPLNKQDVAARLARCALAIAHGRDVVYSGPLYASMTVEGEAVRIAFDHVGSGLASRDGAPLRWFQIAGADRTFHDAEAVIDGETVVVRSEKVDRPVAVRYAWHEKAIGNLVNREGLPASPFRTDRWPVGE